MAFRIVTNSPDETRRLGAAIGAAASAALLILLRGDYGTGKTTFVQGLARGLGYTGAVRSPSYNIVRSYQGGRSTLVHADLYRAGSLAEVDELGLEELAGPHGIIAVEWPGAFSEIITGLPQLRLDFLHFEPQAAAIEERTEGKHFMRSIEIDWSADCPGAVVEAVHAFAA